MSGHGDHSETASVLTEAERIEKLRLDNEAITKLLEGAERVNPAEYNIPAIKAVRALYGLGLKEAKDVHEAMLREVDPSRPAAPYHALTLIRQHTLDNLNGLVADLQRDLVAARANARPDRCPCGAYLAADEIGFCSTGCFDEHREALATKGRISEIDLQVSQLEADIASLKGERDALRSRLNPEANEDEIPDLDRDYPYAEPF